MESPPTDHTITTRVVEVMEQLAALDKLGNPDAIAQFMEWNGITGVRGKADRCPIKKWLGSDVSVGVHVVMVDDEPEPLTIPRCVRTFIVLFDCGHYPFLEAK